MQTVHVGLIGFGYAGSTFHAPLIRSTPGLHLAAVASSDPAKVHAALGTAVTVCSPQALLARPDIDLVVIAAPNDQHHALALAALQAGKHVVVDKPFALDLVQAQAMAAAALAAGRLLSVFHNRRWDGDFLTLQALLQSGQLGRPVELVMHFDRFRPQVRPRWREGDGPGAGLWLDLAPHLIDQAIQLFGPPGQIDLASATLRDGGRSDDWFDARLHWTAGPHTGLRARLHASMLAATPGPRFTLHGTRGSVTVLGLDPQEDALKAGLMPNHKPNLLPDLLPALQWGMDARQAQLVIDDGQALQTTHLPLLAGAYPRYYRQLRDAVLGQAANPVPLDEALAVQAWLDAGRRSAASGRPVALPASP